MKLILFVESGGGDSASSRTDVGGREVGVGGGRREEGIVYIYNKKRRNAGVCLCYLAVSCVAFRIVMSNYHVDVKAFQG